MIAEVLKILFLVQDEILSMRNENERFSLT